MRRWREQVKRGGQTITLWCADFTLGKQRHRPREESKKNLDEAIDAIRTKYRAEKYGLPRTPVTVTLNELVAERKHDLNLKTKNGRRALAVLTNFAGRFPRGFGVTELTVVHLREFVKARHRELPTIAAETINKELGYISGMLNAAPRMFTELADYRPPKLPWAKVSKRKRKRPITHEEEYKLLMVLSAPPLRGENPQTVRARHDVGDLFELALNTGMRGGEILPLKWVQVDFAAQQIYLGKTKNREDRYVELNSVALSILRARYRARRSEFIFPNPTGTRPRYDYLRTFKRVAEELGLPYGQKLEHGFTPHVARHTATTRMLRAGNDMATVQELVGHSDRTMTLIYSHATAETRKRAVDSLVQGSPAKNSSHATGGD